MAIMNQTHNNVTAIILAGGLGRRLNGKNKGLIPLAGKTLIEHVIERLRPQTQNIIINANQDLDQYQSTQLPIVKDKFKNNQGPLAGILSCRDQIKTELVLTVPCDSPRLPENLLNIMLNLYKKNNPAQLCVAHDGKRLQNLFMLFDIKLLDHLDHFYQANNRKVNDWIHAQAHTIVDFSDQQEKFININTEKALESLSYKIKNND